LQSIRVSIKISVSMLGGESTNDGLSFILNRASEGCLRESIELSGGGFEISLGDTGTSEGSRDGVVKTVDGNSSDTILTGLVVGEVDVHRARFLCDSGSGPSGGGEIGEDGNEGLHYVRRGCVVSIKGSYNW
jgi:hypothetical protein